MQGTSLDQFYGRQWFLAEVITAEGPTAFSREELERLNMGDCFSLEFDAERLSGKGAPNRFTAPYTASGNTLSISAPVSTLMAPLVEPAGLKERDYFSYLTGDAQWELSEDWLWLYTRDDSGGLVILGFTGR
ncbi:MAG: META domain-containing protein [Treponema sp.]|nr:META domain-containing protein [Treponema sp.]